MTEQEIRSQIADKEDEITRVEEDASKKDASAEKEIEADFDGKIKDTKDKLDVAEVDFKEATEKSKEWTKKMNKLKVEVASLKKKYDNLVKGKAKALNTKLENIIKELFIHYGQEILLSELDRENYVFIVYSHSSQLIDKEGLLRQLNQLIKVCKSYLKVKISCYTCQNLTPNLIPNRAKQLFCMRDDNVALSSRVFFVEDIKI